jgi:hypothetical protein
LVSLFSLDSKVYEPTETDIFADGAGMDEGTINAYN